ncbi:lysylphosphatidylglycerol synthase transmembrane domain-containing protein [Actinomadura scrupuli]|uniref:lysylphosphatidylglycerol synthase transmembrane domain-containing protein n=1 Tax=Actinomadura scrupuli TaxID=559629 RepID=UPI003D97E81A
MRSWLTRSAMLACVVTVLLLFRDRLPDWPAVRAAVAHASPAWLAVVVVAEWLSMEMFARLQRRLLLGGGVRMSLSRAFAVTYAGNALSTTLPAGPAVSVVYSFRQFRRAGASPRLATAVILLGGVFTTAAYTVVGLAALLSEPHSRAPVGAALAAAAAGIAAVALVCRLPRARTALVGLNRRALRSALRRPRSAWLIRRVASVRGVLRLRRADWGALALLAALNWLFDILSLAAAAKAVGLGLAPYEVALVYFAAQAAGSALPLLPGGLGAIDGSMVVGMAAFGAAPAAAGAATGLYRLVSYWAVVALGWLAWLALRAGETRLRRIPLGRPALPNPLPWSPLPGPALPAAAVAHSGSGPGTGPEPVPADPYRSMR